MSISSHIGVIVRCNGVNIGQRLVDRRTSFSELLCLLSGMTGLDLDQYSLKVSAKYKDNNVSQRVPINNDGDLGCLFDPQIGFKSVLLYVKVEPQLPVQNPFDLYASYLTGGGELPPATGASSSVGPAHESFRHVDDVPNDNLDPDDLGSIGLHLGEDHPSNSEPSERGSEDEEFSDEDDNNEVVVGERVPLEQTPHPNLSMVPFFDSVYVDIPRDSIGIDAVDRFYDQDDGVLKKGMIFSDKKTLQSAVQEFSVKHSRREYKVVESDTKLWKVVCKTNPTGKIEQHCQSHHCNWYLRASHVKRFGHWEITRMGQPHSCLLKPVGLDHVNLCKSKIALHLIPFIQVDPAYNIKSVQTLMDETYHWNISYQKAWYALKRAREIVYGTWESSCQYLPKYMRALQKYNPGTVVEWRHQETDEYGVNTLGYMFWAFKPCIEAFKHCRKVISVDGTHLYTKYNHKLLIAIGLDASQKILPLAYAIVDDETYISWRWFLHMVAKHVVCGYEGMCLISDRHKGILKAVSYIPDFLPPFGAHRFCLRHVVSNFNTKFKNVRLKDLAWSAGSSLSTIRFDRIMEQIRLLDPNAHAYLAEIEQSKWTFCHDGGVRLGIMTTNISECINGVLKGARRIPITAIVKTTFMRTKRFFLDREKEALNLVQRNEKWPTKIRDEYEKMQNLGKYHHVELYNYASQSASVHCRVDGSSRVNTYLVKLSTQECSCGKWTNDGIPCSHAIEASRHFSIDPAYFVKPYYSAEAFVRTYTMSIFCPLPDEEEWDEVPFQLRHNPERKKTRRRGRDRTSRIPNEMDWRETRARQQYQAHDRAEASHSSSSSRRW